jgi:hypothetical protein
MQNIVPRYVDLIWHVFLPYRPLSTITSNCGSVNALIKEYFNQMINTFLGLIFLCFGAKFGQHGT